VTSSEIHVTLTERENDVVYQCQGTNDALGVTVVDTVTLKVLCKCHRFIYSVFLALPDI